MINGVKKIVHSQLKAIRMKRMRDNIVNAHHDMQEYDANKVFDARKYGFNMSESASYKLNEENYKEYISTWESYQPRLANTPYSIISDDKLIFSLVMSSVVDVPTVYAFILDGKVEALSGYNITNENLYDFFVANSGGVLKDREGYDGFGIYVFVSDGSGLIHKGEKVSKSDFEAIISNAKNTVVQKRIVQGSFENNIFDKSVNTVRMISIKKKDANEHEIVAAVQRIGTNRSAPMDNFSQGGGSAVIDLETGELSAMTCMDSFDENGERVFYDKHPDTGTQIKGEKIPHWELVKETIVMITRKLPFFNYVAWDIAITDDGIAVIETNMKSSLRVFQVHGGMRNKYLGQKYREYGYIKD